MIFQVEVCIGVDEEVNRKNCVLDNFGKSHNNGEKSTQIQFLNIREIRTIFYKASVTRSDILTDFLNFFFFKFLSNIFSDFSSRPNNLIQFKNVIHLEI